MIIKKMLWAPPGGGKAVPVYHHGFAGDGRAIIEICSNGYVTCLPMNELSEIKREGYVAIWRWNGNRNADNPHSPGHVLATREEAEKETRDSNWIKVGISKVEY